MRGAPFPCLGLQVVLGIIPADAGSTNRVNVVGPIERDHPRGCGEHGFHLIRPLDDTGSSPRMRGARKDGSIGDYQAGIIPADAGSTKAW